MGIRAECPRLKQPNQYTMYQHYVHHNTSCKFRVSTVFSPLLNSYNGFLGRRVEREGSPYLNDIKTVQRIYETPIANCGVAGPHFDLGGER